MDSMIRDAKQDAAKARSSGDALINPDAAATMAVAAAGFAIVRQLERLYELLEQTAAEEEYRTRTAEMESKRNANR